jgi:hypothetical protein
MPATQKPNTLQGLAKNAWAIAAIAGLLTMFINIGPCDTTWKFVEREAFAASAKETDSRLDRLDKRVGSLSEKIDLVLELLNER